ncbi:MAG: lysophospholipid acyltransferase family protein [Christensenellaceae bacterium]|jgi:hypothetical protein
MQNADVSQKSQQQNKSYVISIIAEVLVDFIHLFLAMLISEELIKTPLFGGALYVAGQFWIVYLRLFNKKAITHLPTFMRTKAMALFLGSLLLNILLFFIYPWVTQHANTGVLIFSIMLLLLREAATDYIAYKKEKNTFSHTLLLTGLHVFFFLLAVVIYGVDGESYRQDTIFICLVIAGFFLLLKQLFLSPLLEKETQEEPETPLSEISSYRIYNKMVINILVAVNLSIVTYILYLQFLPYQGIGETFLGLIIWLAYLLLVTTLFILFLKRRTKWRYDKPTLFFFGIALWLTFSMLIYNGYISFSGYTPYIIGGIFGISLACIFSIIISIGIEMKTVIEIGVGKFDNGAYYRNTRMMIEWAILLSWLLILVMLTVASFITDGMIESAKSNMAFPKLFQLIAFSIPLICVVSAFIYMILQPLDKQYAEKLRIYRRQTKDADLSKPLEERLKSVLVASRPKRIGIRVLKAIIRPFVPVKLIGKENVRQEEMPVVFVCNHLEIYGPIVAVARIPYYIRPWIIDNILDKEIIAENLQGGIDSVFRFLPKRVRRWLAKAVAPIIYWVVHSLDPIPVYRNNLREVVKTIRMTVETLEFEDNILLFPENASEEADGKYVTEGVSGFFTGFSKIGRAYYKKTGKCVRFIPIYINKKKRTLTFGKGVLYDPEVADAAEKSYIVDGLFAEMEEMAKE